MNTILTDNIEEINKINPTYKRLMAFNQRQTSIILGVSEGTLHNWRVMGIGINYIKERAGKKSRVLYPKIEIAKYLSNTIKVA